MANLTSVGISSGVPNSGTGTVSTIDNIPALWDKGSGTGGSLTQRVFLDTANQNANGSATSANSAPVVLASDQGWPVSTVGFMKKEDVASADGDAGIPAMAIQQSSPADTAGTNGDYAMLQMSAGRLWASAKIDTAIPAGTNTMGQVGLVPVTSGGLTVTSTLIASGTNATPIKGSAGQLYKIEVTNNSANIGYLKIYNTAGTPTAGSGTPVIRLMCPGNSTGTGALSTYDNGVAFATGIGFTFTGGIADADTTSVAASAFIVNLYYK